MNGEKMKARVRHTLLRTPIVVRLLLASAAFIVIIVTVGIYANKAMYDFTLSPDSPHTGLNATGFLDTFVRYDGNRYTAVAEDGYAADITNTAFFPLYPLIVRGMSYITSVPISYMLFVVSWVFMVLSTIVLFFWSRFELQQRKSDVSPWVTLGLVAIFPTSFFLILGYNESLFLFLTVSAIFAYRKKNYWLTAILAALSTATRVQGCAIVIFFIADYVLSRDWKDWKKLIPVAAAPIGIFLYMGYLWQTFGNPFQFLVAQAGWGRLSGSILHNLVSSFTPPYLWFLPILVLGLWAIYRYVGKALFVYSLVFILLPLSSGRLDSLNRYMLCMPVLFLAIGLYLQTKSFTARAIYIASSVFLLCWSMLLFMNGYWVG